MMNKDELLREVDETIDYSMQRTNKLDKNIVRKYIYATRRLFTNPESRNNLEKYAGKSLLRKSQEESSLLDYLDYEELDDQELDYEELCLGDRDLINSKSKEKLVKILQAFPECDYYLEQLNIKDTVLNMLTTKDTATIDMLAHTDTNVINNIRKMIMQLLSQALHDENSNFQLLKHNNIINGQKTDLLEEQAKRVMIEIDKFLFTITHSKMIDALYFKQLKLMDHEKSSCIDNLITEIKKPIAVLLFIYHGMLLLQAEKENETKDTYNYIRDKLLSWTIGKFEFSPSLKKKVLDLYLCVKNINKAYDAIEKHMEEALSNLDDYKVYLSNIMSIPSILITLDIKKYRFIVSHLHMKCLFQPKANYSFAETYISQEFLTTLNSLDSTIIPRLKELIVDGSPLTEEIQKQLDVIFEEIIRCLQYKIMMMPNDYAKGSKPRHFFKSSFTYNNFSGIIAQQQFIRDYEDFIFSLYYANAIAVEANTELIQKSKDPFIELEI